MDKAELQKKYDELDAEQAKAWAERDELDKRLRELRDEMYELAKRIEGK